MADINNVILSGRITADPEIKYFDSGAMKTSFSIAVNKWSKKEEKEIATFINCELWGKQAEFVNEYAKKGNQIVVNGSLDVSKYEDDQGNKKTRTFVLVNNLVLPKQKTEKKEEPEEQEINEEDIPF